MRVLLAEDDDLLGAGIRAGLGQQGFLVDWVRDGYAASCELQTDAYQAMILDLGLPRQDGMDVLRKARTCNIKTPILVLTARDAVSARIQGLDAGADDYLIKPVDLYELAARLRALIRRAHGQVGQLLQLGRIAMDPAAHQVFVDGQVLELAAREYDLLHALMLNAGRVLNRAQLEQHLYSWGEEISSNAIEVHIHHLRRKLPPKTIETVRGVGYLMPKPTTDAPFSGVSSS